MAVPTDTDRVDWRDLSCRAALQSHRLVGWIYWDPRAIANYAALGIPDGLGYYIATRGATLAAAGNDVVTAAFYSIHPDFVRMGLDLCRSATTFEAAAAARDAAVVEGLREYVPEICDDLAAMADDLWAAADALPLAGRALFASTRVWPRPTDDALLSAWLAVNSIREWRGDTHWAIQIAEDISGTAAGILDGGLGKLLSPKLREQYLKHCSLKRFCTADEVASLAVWLALKNRYINGQAIVMDGGL